MKHWPDCAVNHGGVECDMGPECGESDEERIARLAAEDLDHLDELERSLLKPGNSHRDEFAELIKVMRSVCWANAGDGSFPGSVCVAITRWRERRQ